MKKYLLSISIFIFSYSFVYSQAPNWLWAKNVAGGDIISDQITADAEGNIYVTGYFEGGSATLGNFTLTNAGGWDMWVAKYDPNGNVLWAKSAGGNGSDEGYGIAIDTAGNVFVTGGFTSSTLNFGSTTLTNNGATDVFLVKYDANGNVVWAKSAGGNNDDNAGGVATDNYGNIFITGNFKSSSISFGTYTLNATSVVNAYIVKYDANGNVVWAETPGGSGGTGIDGYNIVADIKGDIYVTGYNYGSILTFGSYTLNPIGATDAFLFKLDEAGNVHWAKSFGGSGGSAQTVGIAMAVDTGCNPYLTGYFNSNTVTFGSNVLTNGELGGINTAIYITKFDSSGNTLWAKSAGGWNDGPNAIAIDANNNVYITGAFSADSITFGSITLHNYNPTPTGLWTNDDVFLVKYNETGDALWAYRAGKQGVLTATGNGITVNGLNIYASGGFKPDSITFGGTDLTNANPGNSNVFLTRLSTCGLNVNTSTTSSTCGTPTGTATAVASNGVSPFSYEWTNGSNLPTADSLASGLYIVTVFDAIGCKTTAAVNVLDAGAPVITIGSVNNVTCPGGNNGSISISVSGGVTPYTYYWDNGSATQNINNLVAGPYQIQITDANGCRISQVISISQPPSFSLSLSTTTSSCTSSDGSAAVTVSGGTGTYTYYWNTNPVQTTYSVGGIPAGSYFAVITDSLGCKDSIIADIENTNGPIVSVTNINDANCFSGSPGDVSISVNAGSPPYTYLWSNNSTDSTLTAPVGYYYIVVTDGIGCKGVTSAKINDTLPSGVSICEVTVDTNQQNQVIWNRTAEGKIASYNIYRETTSSGNYRLAASQPYDSLTLWVDPVAVPQSRGYRYKITELDSCGDESPMSNYDLTLHLSVQSLLPSGTYKLIWDTSYNGLSFTNYYIYRDTVIGGFTVIDSVAKGTQTYTDYYPTTKNIYYRVGINNPNGCAPTTRIPLERSLTTNSYTASHSNYVTVLNSPAAIASIHNKPSSVDVFPNPSNGKFTIESTVVSGQWSVKVYDVLGKQVYSTPLNLPNRGDFEINLSNEPDGVYMYRIISESGELVGEGKLIIQK